MRAMIDAATDIATIGAWDESRAHKSGDPPHASADAMRRDAEAGHVFLIHTDADGGGRLDAYVDEDVPKFSGARPVRGDGDGDGFLLRVPSGRLVVGGAEDYRAARPRITAGNSVVTIPPGDYRVRCYRGKPDEGGVDLRKLEERVLSAEDREYYRAASAAHLRPALYGYALFLLFPVLVFPLGWKWALAITLAVVLPYFYVMGRRTEHAEKTDERWQRINKALSRAMLTSESPGIILELRKLTTSDGLKGGSVRLD